MPEYLGQGTKSLPEDSQMRRDIEALSDTRKAAVEANARQGLDATFKGQGEVPRPLDEQAADMIMDKFRTPDMKRDKQIQELSERIQDLEKRAKDVQKSGTGNVGAINTYMQAAAILKQRLRKLQSEDVGAPATQPATQPAGGP
jgi:DNA-binding protein H-NS